MRLPIARLLLLAPVLALLTACPRQTPEPPQGRTVIAKGPRDAYVTVVAKFDKDGLPSFEYDHDTEDGYDHDTEDGFYHDTELVRPGDTLEFRCECDEGLEFQVRDLRMVAKKDAFQEELLQASPEDIREQVEQAKEWLERLRNHEGAPEIREEALQGKADGPGSYAADELRPPLDFLVGLLASFEKLIPDPPTTKLFLDWEDSDFHPADAAIGPFEVADRGQTFAATWKFTWTIRAAGETDPDKWVDYDPHIEEEPHPKTF